MKKIVIANLKMHPTSFKKAKELFGKLKKIKFSPGKAEVVIAPPFVYLESARLAFKKGAKLGAQDVFWENPSGGGPYTGEISLAMLKDMKVSHVIVGHSERREELGETNESVNKKINSALKAGFKAVICVGEKERDSDFLPKTVKEELTEGLRKIPKKLAKNLIIAYEPIWAISAKGGKADTPEDLFRMSIFIRRALFGIFGSRIAKALPILYGGSVDEKNIGAFLKVEGISGFLVGGASLEPEKFGRIVRECNFS